MGSLLFLTACQTSNGDGNPPLEALSIDGEGPRPPVEDEAAPAVVEESDARRYCSDDIYSRFLQDSYIDRSSSRIHDKKSFKRARQEAQHDAYSKLNADLPVAFGNLPVQATQRVFTWVEYFAGRGRQDFLLWLVRSESFRQVVVPLLEQEGLPPEFFFLAMIESGFSNTAFSRSAASGTWQFMKPTARHYGLDIDYWVDERRDPIKSTLAAARYLKDLHRQFKDWYLAIAAYNAGPNKIIKAIKGTNSRDYWTLSRTSLLLPETKNYVPKMLAALIIASHPSHYGFSASPDARNITPLTTIDVDRPYRLADIATQLNIPSRELQRWNPEILKGVTPPKTKRRNQSYRLRMPACLVAKFDAIAGNLQLLTIDDVQLHRIQKGETLNGIAKRYKISLDQLRQFNPDLRPQKLKPGQSITVPVPAVMSEAHPKAG